MQMEVILKINNSSIILKKLPFKFPIKKQWTVRILLTCKVVSNLLATLYDSLFRVRVRLNSFYKKQHWTIAKGYFICQSAKCKEIHMSHLN